MNRYAAIHHAVIISGVFMLSGCGKVIEFKEEIQLESGKMILISRRESFQLKMVELDVRQIKTQSELRIVGSEVPAWKANLRPTYLTGTPGEDRYLLVATIPNSLVCYQRGRPNSIYVVFTGTKQGWVEVEAPRFIEGRAANMVLAVEANQAGLGKKALTPTDRSELNRFIQLMPNEKSIRLGSKFGC